MHSSLLRLALVLITLLGAGSSVAGELVTYYHADMAGSPVAATDARGYLMWRAGYEPYGERMQNTADYLASADNRRWFTSHVEDVETGTVYMQARHYDPAIGRFLSTDAVGFKPSDPQTFGRYVYAANNPYRYNDPDGREIVVVTANGGTVHAYNQAVKYLNASAIYRGVHAQLEMSKHVYTVLVDPKAERPAHEFSSKTRTITYNPTVGLRTASGGTQSAALGLAHEETHAARFDSDPKRYQIERKPKGSKEVTPTSMVITWTTPVEEKRATEQETEIAKELGEPTRKSHGEGDEIKVPSPAFSCTKCP